MDLHIRTGTPESVDLLHTPAGAGSRFAAALIDTLIQGAAAGGLLAVGGLTVWLSAEVRAIRVGSFSFMGLLLLLAAAVGLLFKLFFELVWRGQTPGKRALGLRVLRADGLPADYVQLTLRNLLRVVDVLPFFYAAGVLAVLLTPRGQRLGDLVAGTIVVRQQAVGLPALPPAGAEGGSASRLRQHAVRLAEAEMEPVRAFWARRQDLAPAARARLATGLAAALAARMGWPEPVSDPEAFLAALLRLRAGRPQSS